MNIKEQNSIAFEKAMEMARPYFDPIVHQYRKEPKVYKGNVKKCKSCKYCQKGNYLAFCTNTSKTIDLLDFACSDYLKRK